MTERCERCGGAAFSIWRKPGTHLALPLCGTHNVQHRIALAHQGWALHVAAKV